MGIRTTRRKVLQSALAAPLAFGARSVQGAEVTPAFSFPAGLPGKALGDGLLIRHGFTCENTWYNTGWWHTGEDWYLTGGQESAGVGVFAVADGQVVFADSEYPGRVVIVQHAEDLYSMYGHLDYDLSVTEGDEVVRGQQLGTIFLRTEGRAPSHLHFEFRDFVMRDEINGANPSYGVNCGYMCAPGPGYWPMSAPELPVDIGWRNPSHAIARRAFAGKPPDAAEVIVSSSAGETAALWSAPSDHADAAQTGELTLNVGDRYRLISIAAGQETTRETTAEAYRLWYRLALPDGDRAWVQAARASTNDTGSDGRPSSVMFDFLVAVEATS
jgi:murein DD-endopeptidase MepM/ murein hydrolase activator NlpD